MTVLLLAMEEIESSIYDFAAVIISTLVLVVMIVRGLASIRTEIHELKVEVARDQGATAGSIEAVKSEQHTLRTRLNRLESKVFEGHG